MSLCWNVSNSNYYGAKSRNYRPIDYTLIYNSLCQTGSCLLTKAEPTKVTYVIPPSEQDTNMYIFAVDKVCANYATSVKPWVDDVILFIN